MGSPQLENGYIRIANELWDEILRRDFSKRQQNLILLIWRLSYGTGQKNCKVELFNLFELSGIYKQDVKKELKYLRECTVLDWDEKDMIFSINKNYKFWQISPNKNWDAEKFDSLIHHNLSRKKVSKALTPTKQVVSKTLTYKNPRVSDSLTAKFAKHLLRHTKRLDGVRVRRVPKDSIKDIKELKDIKEEEEEDIDASAFGKFVSQNNINLEMAKEIISETGDLSAIDPEALQRTFKKFISRVRNGQLDNPSKWFAVALKNECFAVEQMKIFETETTGWDKYSEKETG